MADEAPTFEQQTANFVVETAEPQGAAEATKETPNAETKETTNANDRKEGAGSDAGAAAEETDAKDDAEGSDAGTTDDAAGESGEEERGGNSESSNAAAEGAGKRKLTAAQRSDQIQQRINEQTRALRDLERRVAEAAQRVAPPDKPAGLTDTARDTTVVEGDAPPDPNKFEYGELDGRYIEAKIAHGVKTALSANAEKETKRQADAAAATKQQEMQQKATALEQAGAKKYDDFSEVVIEGARAGAYPLTPTLGELILTSPEGADVAYHLASNPKEAREIAGKSPVEQAAWFGRTAAKFSPTPSGAPTKAVVKTTQAPPPVKPARGAGANPGFDPATADFETFERQVMSRK